MSELNLDGLNLLQEACGGPSMSYRANFKRQLEKLVDREVEAQRILVDEILDRIRAAVMLVVKYGGIDGEHHKSWVLDQTVRVLVGNEGRDRIARSAKAKGYEWDEGVAP